MNTCKWCRLTVVMLLWWGGVGAARAQAVDTFTYRSLAPVRNLNGTLLPATGRLLLLEAQAAPPDSTYLRELFDQHLRPYRRAVVRLRGKKLYPEQVQVSSNQIIVKLAHRDTLHLLALDSAGRLVGQVREPQPKPGGYKELLPDLPALPGLLYLRHWPGKVSELSYRDASLRLRWQQRLPKSTDVRLVADSAYVWVLQTTYRRPRHPATTLSCLSLDTGVELSRTELGPTPEHNERLVSVMQPGPGHVLTVAGHAYRGRAINSHHSGDLFVLRLSPAGQVLTSSQLPFRKLPRQLGARSNRVAWQLARPDAHGGTWLVGETYSNSSGAAGILRASVSLGLLGYSILRPKDVVSLHVTAAGQAEQVRVLPLRSDRGSFVALGLLSPVQQAQLASQTSGFRTRGLAADSATLVLRSPQQVQAINLRTGRAALRRAAPVRGRADVLYVGPDYLLLAEARSLRTGILLTRLPLLLTP